MFFVLHFSALACVCTHLRWYGEAMDGVWLHDPACAYMRGRTWAISREVDMGYITGDPKAL